MNYIKMGIHTFCSRLGLSLLLVIQFTIALGVVTLLTAQSGAMKESIRLFQPLAKEQGFYVMPREEDVSTPPDFTEFSDQISAVSQTKEFYLTFPSGYSLTAKAYDDTMAERLPMPLKKGVWFTQADCAPDEIPVVIDREQKGLCLGDRFTASVNLLSEGEAIDTASVTCRIVGILKSTAYHLSYSAASNAMPVSDLIRRYDSTRGDAPLVLLQWSRASLPAKAFYSSSKNQIVLLRDTVGASEARQIKKTLAASYQTASFEDLLQNAKNEVNDMEKQMLPFVVSALSIAVIGVLSAVILQTLSRMRTYAIYFVCGARWKHCCYSNLGYLGCLLLLTFLLFFTGLSALSLSGAGTQMGLVFGWRTLTAVIGAVLLVSAASLLPPYFILKRIPPVRIIHDHEE